MKEVFQKFLHRWMGLSRCLLTHSSQLLPFFFSSSLDHLHHNSKLQTRGNLGNDFSNFELEFPRRLFIFVCDFFFTYLTRVSFVFPFTCVTSLYEICRVRGDAAGTSGTENGQAEMLPFWILICASLGGTSYNEIEKEGGKNQKKREKVIGDALLKGCSRLPRLLQLLHSSCRM